MSYLTFRYPITRAYPYKWFPWAAYGGGLCVIILFSLLNFAASGYILTVLYTADYNGTIAGRTWAQRLSFTTDKVVASCQPQNLQVHSRLFTDKLSLVYELDSIWVDVDHEGKAQTLPSLQYANNPLLNCSVNLIHVTVESSDRTAAQQAWTPWGAKALGTVTCSVDNNKKTWINMTTQYEYVTTEIASKSQFVQPPDKRTQSVLWWGQSLLSWYWLNLVKTLEKVSIDDSKKTRALKGSLAFQPVKSIKDITSLDFFTMYGYDYATASYTSTSIGSPSCCINPESKNRSIGTLHHDNIFPDAWIEADTFAKVFYSVILADLGQQGSSSNLLTNESSLSLFSKNISDMKTSAETPWLKAGPARDPYQKGDNISVNITPSMFSTEYLCQVPKMKPAGSLLLSVLVADLVFLNAAWMLLNWFAVTRLESTEPMAYHCVGCMGNIVEAETAISEQKNGEVENNVKGFTNAA